MCICVFVCVCVSLFWLIRSQAKVVVRLSAQPGDILLHSISAELLEIKDPILSKRPSKPIERNLGEDEPSAAALLLMPPTQCMKIRTLLSFSKSPP